LALNGLKLTKKLGITNRIERTASDHFLKKPENHLSLGLGRRYWLDFEVGLK
jgi:hypothetical protein